MGGRDQEAHSESHEGSGGQPGRQVGAVRVREAHSEGG